MLPVLLFILYFSLFSYLLCKIKFVQNTSLSRQWIIGLFLIKIVAGCFYGYIHTKSIYFPAKIDTWKFYFESLPLTDLLKQDPDAFFKSIFGNGYQDGGTGFLEKSNSYWNDLRHNLMVLFMSILNLFSGKNYYINLIFYNFITFFGVVAFYRFCKSYFVMPKKILLFTAFLLPSFVFWSSGFHKEGILFTAIAFILYSCNSLFFGGKKILFSCILVLSVLCLLFLRSYLILFLIPYLCCWIIFKYFKPKNILLQYSIASAIFVILFFNLAALNNKLDLPRFTSAAQKEFLLLGGETIIPTDTLEPTAISFLQHIPKSAYMAFYAPGLKLKSVTYLPALLENILLVLLCILAVFWGMKKAFVQNTTLFFLFFSISLLLFLGLTVPITGAIIRYKSIIYPFLFVSLCSILNWSVLMKKEKHLN